MKEAAVITVPSNPQYLSVIRAVTAAMAELYGMADKVVEELKLAVDEACANVIRHAYGGDTSQTIIVKFILKRGFEVVIEDNGVKAKPELIAGRDLGEVRPGGLGIHFITRAFDVFAFDGRKRKGNRLRLIRHRREDNEDRDRRQ
ncbi:MAG: ATP-binding protein [Nitrospirae bacterium]|nr:ATP-binding protein [Nitrospirota bacterium]